MLLISSLDVNRLLHTEGLTSSRVDFDFLYTGIALQLGSYFGSILKMPLMFPSYSPPMRCGSKRWGFLGEPSSWLLSSWSESTVFCVFKLSIREQLANSSNVLSLTRVSPVKGCVLLTTVLSSFYSSMNRSYIAFSASNLSTGQYCQSVSFFVPMTFSLFLATCFILFYYTMRFNIPSSLSSETACRVFKTWLLVLTILTKGSIGNFMISAI